MIENDDILSIVAVAIFVYIIYRIHNSNTLSGSQVAIQPANGSVITSPVITTTADTQLTDQFNQSSAVVRKAMVTLYTINKADYNILNPRYIQIYAQYPQITKASLSLMQQLQKDATSTLQKDVIAANTKASQQAMQKAQQNNIFTKFLKLL